jgi:hypothetical protein
VKGTNLAHTDVEVTLGQIELDVDKFVAAGERLTLDLEGGKGKLVLRKTSTLNFKLAAK